MMKDLGNAQSHLAYFPILSCLFSDLCGRKSAVRPDISHRLYAHQSTSFSLPCLPTPLCRNFQNVLNPWAQLRGIVVRAIPDDILSIGFCSGRAWVLMKEESGNNDLECAILDGNYQSSCSCASTTIRSFLPQTPVSRCSKLWAGTCKRYITAVRAMAVQYT